MPSCGLTGNSYLVPEKSSGQGIPRQAQDGRKLDFESKSAQGASTLLHKECGPVLATGSCSRLKNVHSISAWGTRSVCRGRGTNWRASHPQSPLPRLQQVSVQARNHGGTRLARTGRRRWGRGCCLPVSSSCKQGSGVLGFEESSHQCRERSFPVTGEECSCRPASGLGP